MAVIFSPLIGVFVLPAKKIKQKGRGHNKRGTSGRVFLEAGSVHQHALQIHHDRGDPGALRGLPSTAWGLVQQQFFPASDRPELLVHHEPQQERSRSSTPRREVDRVQKLLVRRPRGRSNYSVYIGWRGAIRSIRPLDVQLRDNNFLAQFVVVAKGLKERDAVIARLDHAFVSMTSPDVVATGVSRLELGPPVGWPVQYRVSAELINLKVRTTGRAAAGSDPRASALVHPNW